MEKSIAETECTALENFFHQLISNMKMSFPALEDLTGKAMKLNVVLRTTISAASAFLEAFQKVANMALNSKGATHEIGSLLIRLCLRQRSVEDKLKQFANCIMEGLASPLQEHLEDWKKAVVVLDKDHAKESKKAHQEIKKACAETIRLRKKSKKGKPETSKQLEKATVDYKERYEALEAVERNSIRSALVQEHSHFCFIVQCLKPLMDSEVAMLAEINHVEQLMTSLQTQLSVPVAFPDASDCLVEGVTPAKVLDESPNGSQGSRKSSVSSASSGCVNSPAHTAVPGSNQNSAGRNSDIVDSSCKTVKARPQVSWSSSREEAKSPPRVSLSSELPLPPASDDSCHTEQPFSLPDSSLGRELPGANTYAVPCSVGLEKMEMVFFTAADAYAEVNVAGDSQVMTQNQRVMSELLDDGKKSQVVPLEGYVNMNQLACLAVQQQEITMKKEQKSVCFDTLPSPPPPQPPAADPDFATPGAFKSATLNSRSRQQTTGYIENQMKGEILVMGEFENLADSILEGPAPSAASSFYRSLPRNVKNSGVPSSAAQMFNRTASQRFTSGSATIHRGHMRDRSLPPVSRKSSKTTTLPLHHDSAGLFLANSQSPPRQASVSSKQIGQMHETCLESMPLPPPPPLSTIGGRQLCSADSGSVDDLPLPPPPEELREIDVCGGRRVANATEIQGMEAFGGRRHKSVASSHAGIIESLNVKFSEQQLPKDVSMATGYTHRRRASDAMCLDDFRVVCEPQSEDTLSASIRRGVQLRRTVTNDRSAPRLS